MGSDIAHDLVLQVGHGGKDATIAGVCYVINSFALLLSPPLSSRLFPAILIPSLIAELPLALWFRVKENAEKWGQRVHSAEFAGA